MQETSLEVLQPSAVLQLERAQIDGQIATAHVYPRSLEQFKRRALSLATLDTETAEQCIYQRPVGGGKTAEGASIRLAEIVAASYGNIRVSAQIIEQTERYVKAEGVAHDLESNYAAKSQCIEATVMKDGRPYSEGQRAVVAKAALAKAFRDAVFKVVPRALCKTVIDAAKGVISGNAVPLEERRNRVRGWLRGLKVDDARVFAVLEVKGWSDVGDEQLLKLTGIRTAINDNDIQISEAFPVIVSEKAVSPTVPIPVMQKPSEAPVATTPMPEPVIAHCRYCKGDIEGDMGKHIEVCEKSPLNKKQEQPAAVIAGAAEDVAAAIEQSEAATEQPVTTAPATPEVILPVVKLSDSESVKAVKILQIADKVSDAQLFGWLRASKIAKPEQKELSELAEIKLTTLASKWPSVIDGIRRQSAK